MDVRIATEADLDNIMPIFDAARAFMRAHGNTTQWPVGNPSREEIRSLILAGASRVCVEDGEIVGTFAFLPGPDETYRVIEDGQWHFDEPYHVIHRVASNGTTRGVARACFTYCQERADCLRIDTHADNLPMQGAIKKYGFERCGIIHIADGSPRIGFDWHR